ncbi:MAG TPA: HAD-IIB family hydrolase [Planctomycetota bacterium]|nr:HAD-IIB family hydrolase [Planctomycetota bacterium]
MRIPSKRWVLFTDLDGTLLDAVTYRFDAARPGLEALRRAGIPVVASTSKTRAEMVPLMRSFGLRGPCVVENGGAIVENGAARPLGATTSKLLRGYALLKEKAGGALRGFHEMSDAELSAVTRLSLDEASRARKREFDLPFTILGQDGSIAESLAAEARKLGLRISRGGRFHHLHGPSDKGTSLKVVMRRWRGRRAAAIGDSANDLPMLKAASIAFAVKTTEGRHDPDLVSGVPRLRLIDRAGPEGWAIAVDQLLAE